MSDSARTAATGALEELIDVSPQVEAAIVATLDGSLVASSLGGRGGSSTTPERLAQVVVRLLDQADAARTELGREPITQLEVATGTGTVFVVRDASHVVAAITGNEPTVGLVFYDLKTALRTVREQTSSAKPTSKNGNSPNGAAKAGPTKGATS